MRKSVAFCAIFLVAILLGLCGRLPWSRAVEPTPNKPAAVDQAGDPFRAASSPDKPPAASSAEKPAGAEDPWGNFDSPHGKAAPVQPQSVQRKIVGTAKKARSQAIAPLPGPSRSPTMKITVGKAFGPSAAAELAASEEMIEKALLRPVTLEVVETPLDKIVEQLARQLDVNNVLIDQRALNDAGIDPATPVTCKVTNLPLRFALDEILRPLQLTWIIRSGALVVTTPEEAEKTLTTKVYERQRPLGQPARLPGQSLQRPGRS